MAQSKILLLSTLLAVAFATKGIDLSAGFNNFSCVKSAGYSFVIGRGYCSYGAVDQTGLQNLKNAKAAGLITDAYFFPCKGKKTAQQQVDEFVAAFGSDMFNDDGTDGAVYGTVWLDVEHNPSTGCGWSTSDYTGNCNFLSDLVNALKAKGKLVGIYGSKYQWQTIFGSASNCAKFTSLPLWYAHYDNSASFSDYPNYSFGGWSKPSIKQYAGDTTLCGVGVDLNFY